MDRDTQIRTLLHEGYRVVELRRQDAGVICAVNSGCIWKRSEPLDEAPYAGGVFVPMGADDGFVVGEGEDPLSLIQDTPPPTAGHGYDAHAARAFIAWAGLEEWFEPVSREHIRQLGAWTPWACVRRGWVPVRIRNVTHQTSYRDGALWADRFTLGSFSGGLGIVIYDS